MMKADVVIDMAKPASPEQVRRMNAAMQFRNALAVCVQSPEQGPFYLHDLVDDDEALLAFLNERTPHPPQAHLIQED